MAIFACFGWEPLNMITDLDVVIAGLTFGGKRNRRV
jgi:hypothetical protein